MNQNGRNVNPCNDQVYVVVDSTVMFYYVNQALAWSYGTKSVCLLTI